MATKTLHDLDPSSLTGRTVLVRADLNVPLDGDRISDDTRIRASLPTLEFLRDAGARTVVLSHLGRPDGRPDPDFSLAPVAARLGELLDVEVAFSPDPSGPGAKATVAALTDGGLALLENTRFLPGDTGNDPEVARGWAALGTVFVNDAFGAAHRAHASTSGLAGAMRERGGAVVAGFLMARELRYLREALEAPERPFVAVLGGAKISGKIDVIGALLPRVDRLLVGGAMANTFFRAMGLEIGASLVEDDRVETARALLEEAGDTLMLPVDCVVASEIGPRAATRIVSRDAVGAGDRIADIGPATRDAYARELAGARTVVWNGPMGVFEMEPFAGGTLAVAEAAALAADGGATVVLGGGDSAAAAEQAGVVERLSHVSTGGGASLELLAGEDLPGVTALDGDA
ncbi:MAG: phosphoglycerate kinase [Longimicrobiales bacterium]